MAFEPSILDRWLSLFAVTSRTAVQFVWVLVALIMAEPTAVSLAVGGVFAALGFLCRVWTAGYGYNLGELTIKGPYRFVRHPYLLGTGILFLGIFVASRQAGVCGLGMFSLLAVYRHDVRRDERRLERQLGARFQEFRDRVPAFIPALVPEVGLPSDGHSFSLSRALFRGRHRELLTLVWGGGVFALLTLCFYLPAQSWLAGALGVLGLLVLIARFVYVKTQKKVAFL